MDKDLKRVGLGVLRNRHFDAGMLFGIGLTVFIASLTAGYIAVSAVGLVLAVLGLMREIRLTRKSLQNAGSDNMEKLLKK